MIFWYTAVKCVSLPVVCVWYVEMLRFLGKCGILLNHFLSTAGRNVSLIIFFLSELVFKRDIICRPSQRWRDGKMDWAACVPTERHPSFSPSLHLLNIILVTGSRYRKPNFAFHPYYFWPQQCDQLDLSCMTCSYCSVGLSLFLQFSTDSTSLSASSSVFTVTITTTITPNK